jgi:hypothetical protein
MTAGRGPGRKRPHRDTANRRVRISCRLFESARSTGPSGSCGFDGRRPVKSVESCRRTLKGGSGMACQGGAGPRTARCPATRVPSGQIHRSAMCCQTSGGPAAVRRRGRLRIAIRSDANSSGQSRWPRFAQRSMVRAVSNVHAVNLGVHCCPVQAARCDTALGDTVPPWAWFHDGTAARRT